jgi:hypothetical protein
VFPTGTPLDDVVAGVDALTREGPCGSV